MKRRLLTLALFLLLGAVVNVAVAWASALFIDVSRGTFDVVDDWKISELPYSYLCTRWRVRSAVRANLEAVRSGTEIYPRAPRGMTMDEFIPSWGIRVFADLEVSEQRYWEEMDFRTIDGRGWPLLSLWGGVRQTPPGAHMPYWDPALTYYAILLHHLTPTKFVCPRDLRILPWHPIWPGFAINTIFYAGLLWLPFAPRVLRRYVRRRCGRCLKCGYDLRGDLKEGCPECGWRREPSS